jgi:hypothetical protein
MKHEFVWERATVAAKGLALGMMLSMAGFAMVMVGTSAFLQRHKIHGAELYVFAALTSVPILGMVGVVGLYLKRETDEFQRSVMVRSLLGAIAVTLALNFFGGILRGMGAIQGLPPFAECAVFCVAFGLIQLAQVLANRVSSDD